MEELLPKIKDQAGNIAISRARVDPAIETRNVAIGGFRLSQVLRGADNVFGTGMEHFVWDPMVDSAGLIEEPEEKMIDRVLAMKPRLIVTTDVYGNDYTNVDLGTDGIPDLSALTSVEAFRADLAILLKKLDETGAEVFMATGPDVTVLPPYSDKVQKLRDAGYSEQDATAWKDAIRARIQAYNAELLAQVKDRPRVHVIDLWTKVEEVMALGVDVGGQHLGPRPFGGLLSLDAMHFSDTGYAVLANEFVAAVNAHYGTDVPLIDVAEVLKTDPYSVEALRAAGFACAGY
jgi:lysophospholipase L1-like esterase